MPRTVANENYRFELIRGVSAQNPTQSLGGVSWTALTLEVGDFIARVCFVVKP